MSFQKFVVAALVAGSALAASPAYANFANFHFDPRHDAQHQIVNDNDNSDTPCQGWTCKSDDSSSTDSKWNSDDHNWNNDGPRDTPVSGVPEPATWAMFLLGFGGIGFMLRLARRKPAFLA